MAYRPDLEVSKWFEVFNKWFPIFLFATAAAIILCACTGAERVFLLFAKFFISPLKPFLVANAQAGEMQILSWLETISWYVFWALGAFLAYLTIKEGSKATHLAMTPRGLDVVQHVKVASNDGGNAIEGELIKRSIPWESITHVHLNRKPGRRSHLDYELLFGIQKKREPLRIRYGDIRSPFDRMQFINALLRHIPQLCPEEISDVFLSRGERESFTELWLRELTASPKRDKLIPLSPGTTLQEEQYTIRFKIGMGGQATVYLAESAKIVGADNLVAVKEFILPVFPDPRVRLAAAERFHVEAEMIASLKHPQIVRFLDLFIEDHRAYLVLERVEGMNLKQVITARGALSEEVVIKLAVQMCDILAFLHSLSPPVAHRDFTPDNLMLSPDGVLKLIDFSVAQQVISNVTGSVVGKLEYIAPEQFRGKPTPLSDLYSLGATLAFMVTGEEPEAIRSSRPEGINGALADVISRATALDPEGRYQSAPQVKEDLLRIAASLGFTMETPVANLTGSTESAHRNSINGDRDGGGDQTYIDISTGIDENAEPEEGQVLDVRKKQLQALDENP